MDINNNDPTIGVVDNAKYITITISLSSKANKKQVNKFYEMMDFLAWLWFGKKFYAITLGKVEVRDETKNG